MTTLHKNVNGIEVPLSDEDLAQIAIDEANASETQWERVRSDRNARLAACDWTQLPDAPVDAAAWAVYRQALRDITDQSNPLEIVWPTAPQA
ncbi:MAG: tail fiber assembly protein [Shewanella sp.]